MITLRHVSDLRTSAKLEAISQGVIDELRPLSLAQREIVIRRVLDYDTLWARRDLQRTQRLASTLAAVIRRDGVQ